MQLQTITTCVLGSQLGEHASPRSSSSCSANPTFSSSARRRSSRLSWSLLHVNTSHWTPRPRPATTPTSPRLHPSPPPCLFFPDIVSLVHWLRFHLCHVLEESQRHSVKEERDLHNSSLWGSIHLSDALKQKSVVVFVLTVKGCTLFIHLIISFFFLYFKIVHTDSPARWCLQPQKLFFVHMFERSNHMLAANRGLNMLFLLLNKLKQLNSSLFSLFTHHPDFKGGWLAPLTFWRWRLELSNWIQKDLHVKKLRTHSLSSRWAVGLTCICKKKFNSEKTYSPALVNSNKHWKTDSK